MAALVAGVQYGLSSHSNFHENKSLIFVKLTDSAQRAIEDFLRNRNKTSQNPTIQFLGNEGQLSFPSTQSSHGSAGFTFSLSGNQDIEGPQGGFECIQQTGPTSLESLGALPCKMRIQANDDVYETTRHRMAVAEENNKNKCTRVIKANGPDIGRKVKVKNTGRPSVIPPSNNNPRHRESSNVPPTSIGNQSRLSSSYKPAPSNNPPVIRNQPEKKVSDIMRRPLKERLIHLLALRPYKKPELYDRISREGIKERERSTMTTILKQVAYMRDNTYHLHRYVWNDVQEDWPYYSEQEKAMLKRRKPQNLTPPGSSDGGSSGSGQSPNSVHPGSPPAITAPPPNLLSKRPGYYQGTDGLPTKKPRISHYRKPEPGSNSTSSSSSSSKSNENGRTAGSGGGGGGGVSGGVIGSGSVGSCVGGSAGGGGNGGSGGSGGSASGGGNNSGGLFEIWEQRPQQQQQQQHNQQQQQQQQQQHHQHQQQQHQHQHQHQSQQRERRTEYRPERTSNSEVLRGGGSYANGKACLTPSNNVDESNHASDQRDGGIAGNEGNAASVNSAGHNSHSSLTHSNSTCNSSRYHHGAVGGGGGSAGGSSSNSSSGGGGVGGSSGSGGGGGGGGGVGNSKSMHGSSAGENVVGAGVDYLARNAPSSVSGSAGNAGALGGGSSAGGGGGSGGGSNSTSGGYSAIPNGVINERRDRSDRARGDRDRESRKRNSANSGTTGPTTGPATGSTTTDHNLVNLAVSGYNGNADDTTVTTTTCNIDLPESPKSSEYPHYLTYYTTISSAEQRRRYKAEFNADYEEYKRLHAQVAMVSGRFKQLEERLKEEEAVGNIEGCKEVKRQILMEYNETKRDPQQRETKRRFHYLHEKLSHIKRLVLEYDTQNNTGSMMVAASNGNTGDSKETKEMDSLRY